MADHQADKPVLSVVVPVRNGAAFLREALAALRGSALGGHRWELLVVDDGSQDTSASIASEFADQVIHLPPPSWGPPTARNAGVRAARAPLIVFVDADVCVHPDALDRLRDTLARRPELSAAFGAYDSTPPALPLVSQYRNLLHAYVHRRDAGDVVTFWTGLGAVRREAFEHAGGFDEGERLDDVEFGYRLAACGHRILLDPKIQGTHLKRWTLTNVIRTDVRERAVPWVRLLLRLRHRVGPPTLSVRPSEWLLTGLTAIALLAVIAALMTGQGHWWIVAGVAALLLPVFDRGFLGWVAGERGGWFALRILPLRALYYVLNIVSIVIAFLPIPIRRRRGGKTLPFPGRVKEA